MGGYLTPYDTGKRAEPKVWHVPTRPALEAAGPIALQLDEDRFGKVDFDNDSSETLLTVWVEPDEHGVSVVHVQQQGPTQIAVRFHGEE